LQTIFRTIAQAANVALEKKEQRTIVIITNPVRAIEETFVQNGTIRLFSLFDTSLAPAA
jgi:hypothetical protein